MKRILLLCLAITLNPVFAETETEAECVEYCNDIYEKDFDQCAEESPDNSDCEHLDEEVGRCHKSCKEKQKPKKTTDEDE